MKNFLTFILTFFLLTLTVFAQSESEKQLEWKIFSPDSEEFSVEIPVNLNYSDFDPRIKSRRYAGQISGNYYFIFSDTLKHHDQLKTVLKFVGIYKPLELLSQKNSNSMNFVFSDEEKFYHTINIQKTKDRVYIFHLVSEKENDSAVKHFFQSLKINGQQVTTLVDGNSGGKISENELQEPVQINRANKNSEQSKSVSENGNGKAGVGSGNGQGSGFGNGNQDNSSNNERKVFQTKSLKLTLKPKPKYNDFARFYEISGNVRVRVTFTKDGIIGSAIPLTKLPFGLTDSAIGAAKQIRFEPMTENGQNVSVTKVVVFTFTIY